MIKKIPVSCLLIFWLSALIGQQNPFELSYRLSKTVVLDSAVAKIDIGKRPLVVPEVIVDPETKSVQEEISKPIEAKEKKNEELVSSNILKEKIVEDESHNWINSFAIWFLLGILIILAITINMDRSTIGKLFRSAINVNFLNLMYRDQRFRYNPQNMLFSLIFILAGSYFLMALLREFFHLNISILYAGLIILGIYLVRHISMRIIQFAFPDTLEISQFSYTIFVLNIFLGLFLIPLDWIIELDKHDLGIPALYVGVAAFVLLYSYRLLRGIILSSSVLLNNKFRFFVYLCALEIAPIFLVIRIFEHF